MGNLENNSRILQNQLRQSKQKKKNIPDVLKSSDRTTHKTTEIIRESFVQRKKISGQ